MKIYIFKRKQDKGAGQIQAELENIANSELEHSPLKRVKKLHLKEKKNKEDKHETTSSVPVEIYVDSALPFTADDIDDNFSFGNGCSSGSVKLKTGKWEQCCFFVIDGKNKNKFDSKINQIKDVFK